MWRFLQRTRLGAQVREALAIRRSVRQAEHRHSLRVKRAAIQARLNLELHRSRLLQTAVELAQARATARIAAAEKVAAAHDARNKLLSQALSARGVREPPKLRPQVQSVDEADFKSALLRDVEKLIPETGPGARVAREALRESFDRVPLQGRKEEMAVGLLAGVAKDIGLSREELSGLVDAVERDGGESGLRAALLDAMDEKKR